MSNKLKYIELFAGCGGLSLGLRSVGFELELANDLSPMASSTYALNLLNEEIDEKNINNSIKVCTVAALSRITEAEWQQKKMVVGDVVELVETLGKDSHKLNRLKGVELVSGGPPCQGFSLAGKRKERDPKNRLPYAFVDFVNLVQPKIVLLENVEGILRPFKSDGGQKYPWLEIAKAFASIGYAPMCFFLNAKYFGIPQNRPRFVLLGIHNTLKENIYNYFIKDEQNKIKSMYKHAFDLTEKSSEFINAYSGSEDGIQLEIINMNEYISENTLHSTFLLSNLFPQVSANKFSVKDAIHDLLSNGSTGVKNKEYILHKTLSTNYNRLLSAVFKNVIQKPKRFNLGIYNHELRKHNRIVALRFSLIQEVDKLNNGQKKQLNSLIRGKHYKDNLIKDLWQIIHKNEKYSDRFQINSEADLAIQLELVKSKKHTQRCLDEDLVAPAQVSIPDDLCHYDLSQPRVLSVREMARIQSFPDEFIFRSKATTGGDNRKLDVPQYTQVGNAVPPLLGRTLGLLIEKILN